MELRRSEMFCFTKKMWVKKRAYFWGCGESKCGTLTMCGVVIRLATRIQDSHETIHSLSGKGGVSSRALKDWILEEKLQNDSKIQKPPFFLTLIVDLPLHSFLALVQTISQIKALENFSTPLTTSHYYRSKPYIQYISAMLSNTPKSCLKIVFFST